MNVNFAILLLPVVAIGTVLSQTLLKRGLQQIGGLELGQLLQPLEVALRIVQTPALLGGFVLALVVALIWLTALSRLNLSFAGAVLGASYYLLLGLNSWLLLGEPLPPQRIAGLVVISLGVLLVAWS
jgi:drug/metabolite transporter (DMT)-like permease